MKHLIPRHFDFVSFPLALVCAVFLIGSTATAVLAQHAAAHAGSPGRVSAPPASHPVSPRPVAPYRPPVASPGSRTVIVRPPAFYVRPPTAFKIGYPYRPIRPRLPVPPIYAVPILPFGYGWFGFPFFGF